MLMMGSTAIAISCLLHYLATRRHSLMLCSLVFLPRRLVLAPMGKASITRGARASNGSLQRSFAQSQSCRPSQPTSKCDPRKGAPALGRVAMAFQSAPQLSAWRPAVAAGQSTRTAPSITRLPPSTAPSAALWLRALNTQRFSAERISIRTRPPRLRCPRS